MGTQQTEVLFRVFRGIAVAAAVVFLVVLVVLVVRGPHAPTGPVIAIFFFVVAAATGAVAFALRTALRMRLAQEHAVHIR